MKPAQINHWGMEKNLSDFGDLDLVFMVTGGQRMLRNALSLSYLLKGLIDYGQT